MTKTRNARALNAGALISVERPDQYRSAKIDKAQRAGRALANGILANGDVGEASMIFRNLLSENDRSWGAAALALSLPHGPAERLFRILLGEIEAWRLGPLEAEIERQRGIWRRWCNRPRGRQ